MKHFKDNSRDSHSKSPPGRTTIQNILLCCLTLLAISCEKFITDEPVAQPPTLKTLKTSSNPVENTLSIIPADISQFNLLAQTKSALDTAQSGGNSSSTPETFCLDFALMWEYEQQLFFESSKILYRQIPLKAATEKVCCSISNSFGQALYNDSISIVKSYCIIVEYLLKGISKRYIVTMLPKYSLDCFNEKCTYLEKPNYSGLIIFSDTMGKFQKIEHYKNGLILNGELLTAQEISDGVNTANPEDITYLTIYVPKTAKSQIIPTKASQERSFWTDALQTKSNDDDEAWHDLLEEIVVVATRPTPEDNENQTAENDESGGGGITPMLPGINDSGGGGSSSGSSQEEEEPVKYTVTLSIDGGGSVNGGGTYTANSNVTISATPNSGYVFSG